MLTLLLDCIPENFNDLVKFLALTSGNCFSVFTTAASDASDQFHVRWLSIFEEVDLSVTTGDGGSALRYWEASWLESGSAASGLLQRGANLQDPLFSCPSSSMYTYLGCWFIDDVEFGAFQTKPTWPTYLTILPDRPHRPKQPQHFLQFRR